jgi:hypothetical protein
MQSQSPESQGEISHNITRPFIFGTFTLPDFSISTLSTMTFDLEWFRDFKRYSDSIGRICLPSEPLAIFVTVNVASGAVTLLLASFLSRKRRMKEDIAPKPASSRIVLVMFR